MSRGTDSLYTETPSRTIHRPDKGPFVRENPGPIFLCSGIFLVRDILNVVAAKLETYLVYAATCKLCTANSVYVRKTFTSLSQRINGHRSKYYEILDASKRRNSEVHGDFDKGHTFSQFMT